MTWEDVLRRDDIVGGDLETQEDGTYYRGPISKIELRDGLIFFESPWVARLVPGSEWEKWQIFPFYINPTEVSPQDIGDGRIMFTMPFLGAGVIFPKGGSKLDPAKVKGLQLPQ
ncbi:MAG: hypothetical protein WCW47_01370 [Candidatus Paceibacterota bacterium]|jgi:hypothetical protein